MRRKEQSKDRAMAETKLVLPTPGISSINTWPMHKKEHNASSMAPRLPIITFSTLSITPFNIVLICSDIKSPFVVVISLFRLKTG
jgi:hypothetical protein